MKDIDSNKIIQHMYEHDSYSQWLGIKVLEIRPGFSRLSMFVRDDMCNGFGIAHGGISFSFADTALAFASNAHGIQAFSIETSIQHYSAIKVGDELEAITTERFLSEKSAVYEIKVMRAAETVAKFDGTVFRAKAWEL